MTRTEKYFYEKACLEDTARRYEETQSMLASLLVRQEAALLQPEVKLKRIKKIKSVQASATKGAQQVAKLLAQMAAKRPAATLIAEEGAQ